MTDFWCTFWSLMIGAIDLFINPLLNFLVELGLGVPSVSTFLLPKVGCRIA